MDSKNKKLIPNKLKDGDTIGFLAASGAIDDFALLENAKIYFESKGYKVKYSENIYKNFYGLAGSDSDRLKALHNFFEDDEINAIFCIRGGYGAIRIINNIDYTLIKNNPKIFCGFSDITAFLAMFYKKANIITYYSPMPYVDFSSNIDSFTEKSFFNTLENKTDTYFSENGKVYYSAEAVGTLFGGNLSTLASLCGLDFIPNEPFILFLEDWHDPAYKIDRMLTQLLNIKQFHQNIKGLILGEFLSIDNEKYFEQRIYEIANSLKIPISSGFKITHGKTKITLPFASRSYFNSKDGIIKIIS